MSRDSGGNTGDEAQLRMKEAAGRPTLLSACARAATAEEARFRIQDANSKGRLVRVVALDAAAECALRPLVTETWRGARFLAYIAPEDSSTVAVRAFDGPAGTLAAELKDADLVVMVARRADSGSAAVEVATRCAERGIRPIAVVLSDDLGATASALRQFASVLVASSDDDYLREMLTALRA